WHGQTYDQTGTYELPFKTIEGCDSVYTLTLFVDPSYTINQDTTVCFGESFSWNNLYINATEAGEKDYKATLQSIYGTDSIINLHVTVLPRIVEYKQLSFCHGGGVTYNGHTYTQAGRDTLTYQSHFGCDSLLVLTIYENPSYQFFDTVYLAKGETITWHKLSITEFRTYTDSYESVNGCDSTYTLVVYEKPTYNFYQDSTICFGDAFEWHNQKISEEKEGTYTYTAKYTSQYGTDSIYHLTLTMLPKYWTIQQLFFCEGSGVSYGGKTYNQSGRDTLHYTSVLGCDSVVEVVVNIKHPICFRDTINLEEGTTREWRGQTISTAGTYKDEYGCDSIFTLFVKMVHVDHIYQNATICEGDTYSWEGKTYTTAGDYTESYKNQAGNDSIMHLHLTINPKSWVIKHFSLCQGGTIEYNGKSYNKAGRDTLTFTSTLGCDSVEEVIVIETYPFHHYDTLKLEAGTSTQWHGQTISTGGTYKDENTTVAGCDSIYELYVQLYYVDHIYKDTTICYGETYTWEGETFNVSGEYVREKRFTNQAGSDSIMHLHLVILPEYKVIKSFTLCHGSSIEYNGKTYTTSGRDTLLFTSGHGCDSIVEVIVTETYPFYQYDTIRLEEGTTTQWHGQTISEGRTYADEHKTVAGCDSIYYLTVQMVHVDHIYQNASICEGEAYVWEGQTYNTTGDYTASYKNQAGNDSIMHLHLTVGPKSWVIKHFSLCQGSTIEYNGKTYSKAGRDTITFTSSMGCDSIEEVIVTEVYP
ncbi:MAG: hypothetical protein MJZ58_05845, partial [Paludibacteraceae bacterium]|nr:hypothetical protein [Paludibacteraceae bacterium]